MPLVQEVKAPNRRLDSWKEIAAFFDRDERTVKRWEKERSLPVHRLPGGSRARVFAFTGELERWMHSMGSSPADSVAAAEDGVEPEAASIAPEQTPSPVSIAEAEPEPATQPRSPKRWLAVAGCVLVTLVLVGAFLITHRRHAAALTRSNTTAAASQSTKNPTASTGNAEAQELYLQGRYYWDKRTPEDLNKAVDFFTQAVVHDPNYAQAYVGLADCYLLLREFATMPAAEAYPRALAAAKKAVELDPSSAEAHASLAFSTFYWNWDEAGAEREFRRSIELNPDYAPAHQWFANVLDTEGRLPEALQEINRAEQLDPASNAILADKALVLVNLGRVDEGVALLKQLEVSQPGFFSTHQYLSYVDYSRGNYQNYVAELLTAAILSHGEPQLAVARGAEQGFKTGGKHVMLVSMLKAQEKLFHQGQMSPFLVAVTCARLQRNEDAMRYLQAALQQHDPNLLALRADANFNRLHSDPRFQKLLVQTGMAPIS
jgi:tetratricopeptide (TPR) repeat protein